MNRSSTITELVRATGHALPTPDAMALALLEQQKLLEKKDEAIEQKESQLKNKDALIAVLEEKLRLMTLRKYGKSSEKNLSQQDWLADEADMLADGQPDADDGEIQDDEQTNESSDSGSGKDKKRKRKGGRKGLSPDLLRIQKFLHLSDEERKGALETFFVKVKEELDIEPAKAQVIEIMQEKAVFLDEHGERTIKSAAREPHPIGKSIASINLLAWLVIAKYVDGLPLYRLEKILARYGGEITRTTLANWIIRLSVTLQPLLDRLETQLMQSEYIQGDETRIQVLNEPGMPATGVKWIWVSVPQQCGILRQEAAGAVLEAMDVMEESWPSGVCLQGSAPNHLRAALVEGRCRVRRRISRGKPGRCGSRRRVQANYRSGVVNPTGDIKTEGLTHFRDEPIRHPAYWVGGVRRKGSASSIWARSWNCGNSGRDAKRRGQVKNNKAASINSRTEGGLIRISDEVPVMGVEPRGQVVPVYACVNFSGRTSA